MGFFVILIIIIVVLNGVRHRKIRNEAAELEAKYMMGIITYQEARRLSHLRSKIRRIEQNARNNAINNVSRSINRNNWNNRNMF